MKHIPKRYRKAQSATNELVGMQFNWNGKRWTVRGMRNGKAHIWDGELFTSIDLAMIPRVAENIQPAKETV